MGLERGGSLQNRRKTETAGVLGGVGCPSWVTAQDFAGLVSVGLGFRVYSSFSSS